MIIPFEIPFKRRGYDYIHKLISELLGYAGEILLKYGYIDTNAPLWNFRGEHRPYYHTPILNNEVRTLLRDYNFALKEYVELQAQLIRISTERDKTEVNMRWERSQDSRS